MARHLYAVGAFMQHCATTDTLPFSPTIPARQVGPVAAYWTDLFGGW